jgi:hypothetical protein
MFVASCHCGVTKYQKDKIMLSWCKKTCAFCNTKLIIFNKENNKIIYDSNGDHRFFFLTCPCKSSEFLEREANTKWSAKVCKTCDKRMCVYVVDIDTIDVEFFYDFNKNKNHVDSKQLNSQFDLQTENEELCKILSLTVPEIDIYETYNYLNPSEIDNLIASFAEQEQSNMYCDFSL